jgi:hypothetical protein
MAGWPIAQADIGTVYDIGFATRDNSTVAVKDAQGNTVNLSAVAYMRQVGQAAAEPEEATNLTRKDQLTQFASSNAIDRDFTLTPRVSQGLFNGGEGQKVLTDFSMYYQGRGLMWPLPGVFPQLPQSIQVPASGTASPAWYTPVAAGYLTNYGYGIVQAVQSSGSQFLRVIGNGSTIFLVSPNGQVTSLAVLGGAIYFTVSGNGNLYETAVAAGGGSLNAATIVGSADSAGDVSCTLIGGVIGGNPVLVAFVNATGRSVRVWSLTSLTAGTSLDIPMPTGFAVQSADILGSQVYMAVTDQTYDMIVSFDIPSTTTTTVAVFEGYTSLLIKAVSGALFLLAGTVIPGQYYNLDAYLLVGSSLQLIGTIPKTIQGNFGGALTYNTFGVFPSMITAFGPYAIFPVGLGNGTVVVFCYDVQRGAFFRLSDQIAFSAGSGLGIDVVPGLNSGSFAGVNPLWSVVVTSNTTMAQLLAFLPTPTPLGQVITSLIDFTSSQPKLFQAIIINHPPLAAGTSVYVAAFHDQTPDALGAPSASITHSYSAGDLQPTLTILILNKVARKVVVELDWNGVLPTDLEVLAGTGWSWTLPLWCSDTAQVLPRQDPAAFARQQIDAMAAYNFLRQLWRQKAGLCIAYLPNGESWNAAIEQFQANPHWLPEEGGHPQRYESVVTLKFREDV